MRAGRAWSWTVRNFLHEVVIALMLEVAILLGTAVHEQNVIAIVIATV